MNVVVTNDIKNEEFSTIVSIESFGDTTLTSDEELALIDNYASKIIYKNLNFSRKFKVAEGLPIISEDEDAVEVAIRLNNLEIPIDANFKATYSTSLKKTLDAEVDETVLTTKELVCEAKCILFADVIKEELKRIKADLTSKAVGFEGETEETI